MSCRGMSGLTRVDIVSEGQARGSRALKRKRTLKRGAAWLVAAAALTAGLSLAMPVMTEGRSDRAGPQGAAGQPKPEQAAPWRVVSLNPCLDAILLEVANPGQIRALSHYSHDPAQSAVADRARNFPVTYETAEEILMLEPDLVLASIHDSPATRRALEKMNIPVLAFGVPETVEESHRQIREVAARVGHPERGEALIRRIDSALEALRPAPGARPVPALILQPGGFSPGNGTLQDDLLARAGLQNVAARYGVRYWGVVRLEELVANPPRLLLTGESGSSALAGGDRMLAHPVLKRLRGRMVASPWPPHLLFCGGPTLLEAAHYLRLARNALDNAS